ncbi:MULTISPECIES: ribosome small subunit-dependent GTPase A [unclassified Leucobacter]|uniref:ribosome small subunit-dependent GTPase A n=1 Tax=unclassified Leucobacter TaxID=2621730 RepID=UPI00165E9FF5|nr:MULTISPECIES: ribosome small subunit-dependent GTPase A [unclassified Leucobacter]MBC9926549.1 ribosome small subunit-dependent GTPase A [Leucobacter sp. cx-169]
MSWLDGGSFDDAEELEDKYEQYDEQHIRARPNPKANRPRTKIRPDRANAEIGMITGVDRGRYTVLMHQNGEGGEPEREIVCARARELAKTSIVTGDRVRIVGDTTGREGTLGRIVEIVERTTLLRRSADDTDRVERVIVANADQMLIVVAAANPEPRVRLVDRYLVAAYDAGLQPILCITKTDLQDPTPFLDQFAALDVPAFLSAPGNEPLEEITQALLGHTTVFVGHSGVGKSTLINALVPSAERATGHVNAVTGRGRHTSSSTVALRLQQGMRTGWVVDTPGVRSFGLGHVTSDGILRGFKDLAELIEDCPRGCTHLEGAPDCELDAAVRDERLDAAGAARVESLRRLLG